MRETGTLFVNKSDSDEFCLIHTGLIHTSGTEVVILVRPSITDYIRQYIQCGMICCPHEGSCCSSVPLFPCCFWKRISTIRVSWDCVLAYFFFPVCSVHSYCHQDCDFVFRQEMILGCLLPPYLRNIVFQQYRETHTCTVHFWLHNYSGYFGVALWIMNWSSILLSHGAILFSPIGIAGFILLW